MEKIQQIQYNGYKNQIINQSLKGGDFYDEEHDYYNWQTVWKPIWQRADITILWQTLSFMHLLEEISMRYSLRLSRSLHIVGRCADYVLKDYPGCINVFICASKEDRKNRVMDKYHLSERKAAEKMKKIDRERKYYYETYSGKEWGSIQSHEILMNSSLLGKEKIVEYLAALYKEQQEE